MTFTANFVVPAHYAQWQLSFSDTYIVLTYLLTYLLTYSEPYYSTGYGAL